MIALRSVPGIALAVGVLVAGVLVAGGPLPVATQLPATPAAPPIPTGSRAVADWKD